MRNFAHKKVSHQTLLKFDLFSSAVILKIKTSSFHHALDKSGSIPPTSTWDILHKRKGHTNVVPATFVCMYFQSQWKNTVDPDQMASSEAIWSGSTVFSQKHKSRFNRTWFKLYSKACLRQPLKKNDKTCFKTDYRLMQVKSITKCPKGTILQYCDHR